MNAHNDWYQMGMVAFGGTLGMMLGQTISHKIANALLQKIFAVSLFIVSFITLGRYFL
jgi:hypothetical protein